MNCLLSGSISCTVFKVWERNLEEYRHSLFHLPESRDTTNPILESASKGREELISSLMNMNARYEKLLNEVQLIMEELVETLKKQGKEHKEVSFTSKICCTLTLPYVLFGFSKKIQSLVKPSNYEIQYNIMSSAMLIV